MAGTEKSSATDAVGFFAVQASDGTHGCAGMILVAIVFLTLVFWETARDEPAGDRTYQIVASVLSVLCVALAVRLLRSIIQKANKSNIAVDSFACRGLWIAPDRVYAGIMDMCCVAPVPPAEFNRKESIQVAAIRTRASTRRGSPEELQLGIQLAELTGRRGVYRIGRIQVGGPGLNGEDIDFLGCARPVVVTGGEARSCFSVVLGAQLSAIARLVRPGTGVRCRIVISPRAGEGVPSSMIFLGAIGGAVKSLVESVQGSSRESAVRDALRSGSFVDPETSRLLLQLIEKQGWEVDVNALTPGQRGLVGTKW
jgi:hypothetical protein